METYPSGTPISSKRAAQILNVTDRSIRRWAADGVLPAMKMEGKTGAYVFSPDVIETAKADGIVRAGRVILQGQRREPVAS